MSWNIKTPGDYINGPLTVAGSATITGDLTVRTNKLKVDATGVAIGATSATYLFDVRGTDTTVGLIAGLTKGIRFVAGASTVKIEGVDNTGAASYQPLSIGGSALDFSLSGTTAMTLNSTGLGIGGSPASKLSIADTSPRINFVTTSGLDVTGYIYNAIDVGTGGKLVFGTKRNGNTALDALTIDSSQNVGIGVTPSAWNSSYKAIQNQGGSVVSGTTGHLRIYQNAFQDASNQQIYINSAAASLYSQDAGSHIWFNAASGTAGNAFTFTQAMTLDASGNLLMGTTSGSFGSRLVISADTGTTKWATGPLAAGPANYYITANNTQGVFLNGTAATAWTAISDERFKDIIEPISNAIAKVGLLRSVIGKFKTDAEGTRRAFLIAQDVLAAFPEAAVATNPDKLAVTYTEVIPLLVAAIKELTARVQTLEAR